MGYRFFDKKYENLSLTFFRFNLEMRELAAAFQGASKPAQSKEKQ